MQAKSLKEKQREAAAHLARKRPRLEPLPAQEIAARQSEEINRHLAGPDGASLRGEMIEGKGIYLGTWEPRDEKGQGLGKIFNVFAAPEDLRHANGAQAQLYFSSALRHIAELKGWHGHDGAAYEYEHELREALNDGSYQGEWIMPPHAVLAARGANNKEVYENSIFALRNKGALKNTFMRGDSELPVLGNAHAWYWACKKEYAGDRRSIWVVNFFNGQNYSNMSYQLSCRPVRLEPV